MFIQKEKSEEKNDNLAIKRIELEEFIKKNIPLANFMNFRIEELKRNFIKLSAPIKPNDNHYGTAFGGSLAILGILAGWGLLHFNMLQEKINGTIVIKEGTMKFIRPALSDFEAINNSLNNDLWESFKKDLLEKGKAEIKMESKLYSQYANVALHVGSFVGLMQKS
ncbi:MAG: hypothetical protein FJW56_08325 [Actinobacteria bacterium]|nr:hypothetical protein [Actinomycetota bacterium]